MTRLNTYEKPLNFLRENHFVIYLKVNNAFYLNQPAEDDLLNYNKVLGIIRNVQNLSLHFPSQIKTGKNKKILDNVILFGMI